MALSRSEKRDTYLRKKYGITLEIYKAMLQHGNGCCWICLRKPKPGKNLNVDHEHPRKAVPGSGGNVRGLLCYFCNKFMVGRRRKEHADLFDRTAAYLRSTVDWRKHATNERGTTKGTTRSRTSKDKATPGSA